MRSKSLGLVVLALLLAGVIVTSAAAGDPPVQSGHPGGLKVTPGTQPTLVSKAILRDGAAKMVFSDGSVYVGEPDAQITFDWPDAQTEEMSAALPTPTSAADLLNQIAAYQAHGRSVAEDMREAGFAPPGKIDGDGQNNSPRQVASARHTASIKRSKLNFGTANQVYQSACQTVDNGAVFWKGCIVRKGTASTDPNYYYLADSTNGTGYGTGSTIAQGSDHLNYPNTDLIVDQNPSADYNVGSCTTLSFGLNGYGASLGVSFPVCPTKIGVTPGTQNYTVGWFGCRSPGTTVGAGGNVFVRVPAGVDYTAYLNTIVGWGC